jgi:signal transduction histidine kinase
MDAFPVKNTEGNKRTFSPIYLAILSGVLLIILGINGFLEINRARKGFYSLLEKEGATLLLHFEKNIQETLSAFQEIEKAPGHQLISSLSGPFFGFEETAAEYLLEGAHRIDQLDGETSLASPDLQSIARQYGIGSIEVYDSGGRLLKGWPSGPATNAKNPMLRELIEGSRPVGIDLVGRPMPSKGEGDWFSIVIRRKSGPGMIALYLNVRQMKTLFRQFAIQRAISDMTLREGILFLSVQDASFNTLAHSNPSLIGHAEESPFLKDALQKKGPLSRLFRDEKGEEVLEVAKSFSLDSNPAGIIRVGFSPREIYPALGQIKKNVALSIFIFLILGVTAVTLIWVNQNRHVKKMEEMEDRVHLTERLSSLGHLAAGVAHEIRNPLNAIGMGLQRLRKEFVPQEAEKKQEYLTFTEVVYKEVRRVNGIIEQFLSLSRPFQLQRRASSLQDLLKNLTVLFREEASAMDIRLQEDWPSDLPPLEIDGEKLTQALVNIMKNGMEAAGKGGVLRIEAHPFKDRIEVSVSDSGPGIPPDEIGRIFDYYYTTKEKGAGLGLPIAHRIIEAHGGQVKVASRVGSGTKVTVTLPVKAPEG